MSEYFISPIDPRDRRAQAEMDELLRQEGIRRDANLDYSCGLYTEDYEMAGIDCMIIPRFGVEGVPVSASAARRPRRSSPGSAAPRMLYTTKKTPESLFFKVFRGFSLR